MKNILKTIKRINPFKTSRIIEYRGKFIPQYREFGLGWKAFCLTDSSVWYSLNNQLELCSFCTLEEAKQFKKSLTIKIHY